MPNSDEGLEIVNGLLESGGGPLVHDMLLRHRRWLEEGVRRLEADYGPHGLHPQAGCDQLGSQSLDGEQEWPLVQGSELVPHRPGNA